MHMTFAAVKSGPWIHALASGVRQSWLANEQFGGSRSAQIRLTTIPSEGVHTLDDHGGERICVLVDGDAELLTANRNQSLHKGAVVHTTTGEEFTIRSRNLPATLLTLSETLPPARYSQTPAAIRPTSEVECFSLFDVRDEILHQPEVGFHHMGTRMLLNASRGAYQSFIFGQSSFAPSSGIHVLHRHPGADENFYIWEGSGSHLTEDGTEYPMNVGDNVFVPRTEWHGFRNTGNHPVRAFFCLIGTGDMHRAGNEVYPTPHSNLRTGDA